jgi:putative endonuclease
MTSVKGDGRGYRGRLGESAALALVEREGYRIVDTNVRLGRSVGVIGEIDIVAWDGPTLCFIEVKTRRGTPGRVFPGEAVTAAKQRQIANLALAYANRCGLLSDDAEIALRFDVVLVVLSPRCRREDILNAELWRNAFQAPDDL